MAEEPDSVIHFRDAASPARDIQKDVHRLKRSIDDSMAHGGALIAKVIRASRTARLNAYDTQPALERVVASLTAVMTARTASLAAHDELRDLAGRLDLNVLGWGDLITSPKSAQATSAEAGDVVPLQQAARGR